MTAYRPPLSPTQSDNTSSIPTDKAKLSHRRKSVPAAISNAVTYSKREFSALDVSPRRLTTALTTDTLTSRLTHRIDKQPIITVPFSYHVGGALSWNDPTYIKRTADSELFDAIKQGQFAYVLGPRQIGKSSLRIQTRHQLTQQGYRCVTIQANQLRSNSHTLQTSTSSSASQPVPSRPVSSRPVSSRPVSSRPVSSRPVSIEAQACSGFIASLWADLNLSKVAPLRAWLKATSALSVPARLTRFSNEILTDERLKTPVVIFIDEIDAMLGTPFLADLLAWIQQCSQRRLTETAYQNLNFVILGTTTTSALIETSLSQAALPQPTLTGTSKSIHDLFANGCPIVIPPFQLVDTFPLHQGFAEKIDDPIVLLKAVFKWTEGQPFLTQKLCHIASHLIDTLVHSSTKPIVLSPKITHDWLDNLVRSQLIKNWTTQDDPIHFRAIRDRLVYSPNSKALLTLYKAIYTGTPVRASDSTLQAELLLTGTVITVTSHLKIANPIYREIFAIKPEPANLHPP